MSKKRPRYSREFKLEAVRLVTVQGLSVVAAARDLGVSKNTLWGWKQEFADEVVKDGASSSKSEREELARLRRELERVRLERDILKKAVGYFANDSK